MEVNKIYCENCLDTMARMPNGFVDLTVTSPPYDDLREYHGCEWNLNIFQQVAQELYRVTKPGGVVVWVINDKKENGSESGSSLKQAIYFLDIGLYLHDKMIYKPLNGAMGATNEYLQSWEFMFVFSKGVPKSVNLIRDRRNIISGCKSTPKTKSRKEGAQKERKVLVRGEFGRRTNVWEYAVGGKQELGYHPAPFPEQLAADHIYSWSNEGDLVYDPFGGSGTTAKMAHTMKRNWIMSEISEEYCKLAEKRLEPYLRQMTLAI